MLAHTIETSHCTQTAPGFRVKRASSKTGIRLSSPQDFTKLKKHQRTMTQTLTITEVIPSSILSRMYTSLPGETDAICEEESEIKNEQDKGNEKVQQFKNIT